MKKNILCVDDMKTNLLLLENLIEDLAGDTYHVILASSAKEAIQILNVHRVDLIIMDIIMPDVDGLEAAKIVKSQENTKDIPIIFVTGKTDDETISSCFNVGGDDYVRKPFNSVELMARIKFHIDSRQKDILLKSQKEYAQNILDLQENLIFVVSENKILTANKALLDFYDVDSIFAFSQQFGCISNTFVHDQEYFFTKECNMEWFDEVIKLSDHEDVLVKVIREARIYIFNVKVKKFLNQYIVTLTDITLVSQQSLAYKYEANYDALTHVLNRNAFYKLLDRKIVATKMSDDKFVLVILDIDHFKLVNDTYGHLVGDEVLINLSSLVGNKIRQNDVFARWGGEEFVLIFNVEIKKAQEIVENLRMVIETAHFDDVQHITCSFGIAQFRRSDSIESLLERADEALYKAKESGRNKVCVEVK